jgi:hypothetical protein
MYQLRERHSYLQRFENDWATEAMVRQYTKNKRKTHYSQGTLKVDEKYRHLKDNAAKRDQSKSRKRKGLEDYEKRKAKAKEAKRRGKGKRRLSRRVEDDNEEPEFVEGSSKDGAGDDDSGEKDTRDDNDGGNNDENSDDDG